MEYLRQQQHRHQTWKNLECSVPFGLEIPGTRARTHTFSSRVIWQILENTHTHTHGLNNNNSSSSLTWNYKKKKKMNNTTTPPPDTHTPGEGVGVLRDVMSGRFPEGLHNPHSSRSRWLREEEEGGGWVGGYIPVPPSSLPPSS